MQHAPHSRTVFHIEMLITALVAQDKYLGDAIMYLGAQFAPIKRLVRSGSVVNAAS